MTIEEELEQPGEVALDGVVSDAVAELAVIGDAEGDVRSEV
jgi:hypothetical protein